MSWAYLVRGGGALNRGWTGELLLIREIGINSSFAIHIAHAQCSHYWQGLSAGGP